MAQYWMGDDDGGFFDDGGGYDDDPDQDSDDQDQDGDEEDQDEDADQDDDVDQDDTPAAGGGGGGDDNGDENNVDDEFSDPDDLIGLDDDTALSAADFPNATEADFQDDQGTWTPDDYQQSAANLFGDHEFFGDTMVKQRADEGFQYFDNSQFMQGFDQVAPGSSETVRLFEREGHLSAFGFVTHGHARISADALYRHRSEQSGRHGSAARRAGYAATAAARFRFHSAGRRRRFTEILHAGRRPGADLAVLRLRVDPRHGDGRRI